MMPKDLPEVSAVVPTHNRRELAVRTVKALLEQQGVDLEVVAVDDGSADGTAEALEALRDPRLRVIRQPNAGLARSRNRGLAEAKGRYVLFNDDDIVPEGTDFLLCHLELHRHHPRSASVSRVRVPEALVTTPFMRYWRGRMHRGTDRLRQDQPMGKGGFWAASLSLERRLIPSPAFADFGYGWEEHELGYRLWRMGVRPRFNAAASAGHEDVLDLDGMLTKSRSLGRMAWRFLRLHPTAEVAFWTGANPLSLGYKRLAYPWARAERLLSERSWEGGGRAETAYSFVLEAAYTKGLLEGRGAA